LEHTLDRLVAREIDPEEAVRELTAAPAPAPA
jgi:hypothetical protein